MDKTIALHPRLSEKTYGLSTSRVYVLEIPRGLNKHGVARAVEAQFEVKVETVNIANIPGKAKRIRSLSGKRVQNTTGRRPDLRKAYVTLAKGHSLPFFEAIEEEEQKEQALQEKVDKAAAKEAAKTSKQEAKAVKPRRGFRLPKKAPKSEDSEEQA